MIAPSKGTHLARTPKLNLALVEGRREDQPGSAWGGVSPPHLPRERPDRGIGTADFLRG